MAKRRKAKTLPKQECELCNEVALIRLSPPLKGYYCLNCGVSYNIVTAKELPPIDHSPLVLEPEFDVDFEVLLNERTLKKGKKK